LREKHGLTLEQAGAAISMSGARISKVELGDIKISAGGVIELLQAYGVDLESDLAQAMVVTARAMRSEAGWWQRMESLTPRFSTYLAYENEATDLLNFEFNLVSGILQTEAYARAVIGAAPDSDETVVDERVKARIKRQEAIRRGKGRLRVHAVVSEAALLVEVGGRTVLREQLDQLAEMSALPNVRIQVLRFAAGASMADNGGFAVLRFAEDPSLGYIDTLAGPLFLEDPRDIDRLMAVFDNLRTLALSPLESIDFIKERSRATQVD